MYFEYVLPLRLQKEIEGYLSNKDVKEVIEIVKELVSELLKIPKNASLDLKKQEGKWMLITKK